MTSEEFVSLHRAAATAIRADYAALTPAQRRAPTGRSERIRLIRCTHMWPKLLLGHHRSIVPGVSNMLYGKAPKTPILSSEVRGADEREEAMSDGELECVAIDARWAKENLWRAS